MGKLVKNSSMVKNVQKFREVHPEVTLREISLRAGLDASFLSDHLNGEHRLVFRQNAIAIQKTLAAWPFPVPDHAAAEVIIRGTLTQASAPEAVNINGRPGAKWWSINELAEFVGGTRKQVGAWVYKWCAKRFRLKANGKLWIHTDALEALQRYAEANNWNGQLISRKGHGDKGVTPVGQTEPAKAIEPVKMKPVLPFSKRMRIAWRILTGAQSV